MYNRYSDLSMRFLYEQKAFWESEEVRRLLKPYPEAIERAKTHVIDYKREIRRRNKQPASSIIARWGEYGYWTEVVACPAWVECEEDAEEFFEEELDLPPIRSMYDCTGRAFVSGHKVGRRCGKWVVYVHKGLDV
jgi:hypothetical protein